MMRKLNWLLLITVLSLVGINLLLVETIPPLYKTRGAIHMSMRRVLRYAHKHGKLPSTLSETEKIEGFNSTGMDGWGVGIEYIVGKNDVVTLRSWGKDRKPGGSGDDIDTVGIFSAKTTDGSWSDENVEWIQDPLGPFPQTNSDNLAK